jgi:hypothetical protein
LSSREDQPPAAPSWTTPECLRNEAVTVPQRAQAAEDARPQRLASRRLMPIRAPSETTNLIAAHVNVGTGAGGKPGAETSVGRMMNTFKQISRFWEISEKIRAIVPLGSS